jgi:hypothetical protein
LTTLLEAGVAVCLADVRGTGETVPGVNRGPGGMGLAATELMLGGMMLGARIRTPARFAYLARRPDIDAARIALWGDSLALVNPDPIVPYESYGRRIGPRDIPGGTGALLALYTAHFESGVRGCTRVV